MLYVFRVDIGETYIFETDLAFRDVKTLKSAIEHQYGVPSSKQILIINGGELLDDDGVQVCMKTRETCAGTEENPIYLLDKSHLERSRPLQTTVTTNSVPTFDNSTVEQWLSMPPTYETIVQRADTAQNFNKYAQKTVQICEKLIHEQQTQYQGWMAVIANIEDTLSSFLLNRNSFDRSYRSYLSERQSYLELFQNLAHSIEMLHQLRLPPKLLILIESSTGLYQKSTLSTSTSSSSICLATTSTNDSSRNENDRSNEGNMSLFEWITAQLANVNINDIVQGCTHSIEECNEEFLSSMNSEIEDLSKKISNHELKHMIGIEERFALLQNELSSAKRLQHEQKDCADYLVSQRQRFSSNVGNQKDWTLIKDISGIHAQNLTEMNKRHQKLIETEKKIRKSKQDIIDQLHRRFKNLMLLQRHLVDYDAKQSLYIHKLNRTRKTVAFLRQLNSTPKFYYSFLFECIRRKQYSNIFNQFSETIHRHSKIIHNEEMSKREQFIKQFEPHFLFNLLPGLKTSSSFFIKEPLSILDSNLPDITLDELDQLFDKFPEIKTQQNEALVIDPTMNLSPFIHCTKIFIEDSNVNRTEPIAIHIPSLTATTATNVGHGDLTKQIPSPTNSSSRSTVVRSRSSSDIESPNELSTRAPLSQQQLEQTLKDSTQLKVNLDENDTNESETSVEEEKVPVTKSLSEPKTKSHVPATNSPNTNEEEDDFIQCSLETVYTSTEMTVSPPTRSCASQQTDNDYIKGILNEYQQLKQQFQQSKNTQHDLLLNYHETILKVIKSLQQSNYEHKKQVEQLNSDIQNQIQDNESLKIQIDVNEQLKQELTTKCLVIQSEFDEYRRTTDNETSQIVKALQSDFEFELERIRCEHQEQLNKIKNEHENKQNSTSTVDTQTEQQETLDKQTSVILTTNQDQSTETDRTTYEEKLVQTSSDEYEQTIRRSITKDHQIQFNLAIQRAVQNATTKSNEQIQQLEQQLEDKRSKILKLKQCIKTLQNFYTLSSTPPSVIPSIANSIITTSADDEQQSQDEQENHFSDRTTFIKRSEPISMPTTFVVQSLLAAGNATSSPKIEQPTTATTVNNLLIDTCFKSSPSESSSAVELYTPFAASPPNSINVPSSPQTPLPVSSLLSSPPSQSSTSRLSTPSTNLSQQAVPIAFFTVNRSDHVIIYFDQTYQHFMVFTYLSTLHFIHSDCYELFNIQQRQHILQQQNLNESISSNLINNLSSPPNNVPTLINTSMINSTFIANNGLNLSSIPLLGEVTDKEYCQAKKQNNRFNVPIGTKFYRVRVKPWKPIISTS